MCIELKIKAKHLALEPAIIRTEERKLKKQIKWMKKLPDPKGLNDLVARLNSLQQHRRNNVCNEARATHLARTFIAGKPYSYAEKSRRPDRENLFRYTIIPRIAKMIEKYGSKSVTENFLAEWANQ